MMTKDEVYDMVMEGFNKRLFEVTKNETKALQDEALEWEQFQINAESVSVTALFYREKKIQEIKDDYAVIRKAIFLLYDDFSSVLKEF